MSDVTTSWKRHFFYRSVHLRTTWKFRVAVVAIVLFLGWLSRDWLSVAVASSLVCDSNPSPSDAILVENFDSDYLLFERATELSRQGFASRVLVPIRMDADSQPNAVALGTARLMANIAHLGDIEIVPIREIEPISLNAANDVLRFVRRERIGSVIIVAPYFRSRRSALVYGATLGRAGISLSCGHVQGTLDVNTWTSTLHGIQNVAEQWLKLHYYRLYVLPFHVGGVD